MYIMRKLLVPLTAFVYTLLYGIPHSVVVFNIMAHIGGRGSVSQSDLRAVQMITAVVLHIILAVIVIYMYEKMRGALVFAYVASLTAAFLMPLIFTDMRFRGIISFSWQFDGAVWVIINLLFGPAMVLLLSCLAVRLLRKRRG